MINFTIVSNMNENQKADLYGQLLNEHTRTFNNINEIKGQGIDLNQDQLSKINQLEKRLSDIMRQINLLLQK